MQDWSPKGKKLDSKNIYHRYLEFPFEISKHPLCNTMPKQIEHHDINPWRCKKLNKFLSGIGLMICHTEVFYTPPGGAEIPIHADDAVLDNRAKINITYGPKQGRMRWWQSTKTKNITGSDEIAAYAESLANAQFSDRFSDKKQRGNLVAEKKDSVLMHEASTNNVSLVNVGQLHSTYNPHPSEGRWTLCFIPGSHKMKYALGRSHLTFEEAVEAFSPYIKEK
jgi:hypothetical protein